MDKMSRFLDISILLSAEKDRDRLFEHIIRAAMDLTNADGGTLYVCGDNCLEFKIMITLSTGYFKGGKGDPVQLPPVPYSMQNVCTAAVLRRKIVNIPDVYDSNGEYDFSGPMRYDSMTGYHTGSILVVPMENDKGEIIGVLQLINAMRDGRITPFDGEDEHITAALGSQAAICLTNVNYSRQVTELLYGFVRVMSTGIDARSPYNANHTRNMVRYGENFFDYEEKTCGPYALPEQERGEVIMSVWLHDIGKLVIPLEVMDKSTRLGSCLSDVEGRFDRIALLQRLAKAEGRMSEAAYEQKVAETAELLEFIRKANTVGFMTDEMLEQVQSIAAMTYTDADGSEKPYLTEEETHNLSIRKGTLTAEERAVIESHATMTGRMLSELTFPHEFENVPFYAGAHHEYPNGKGYPNHLTSGQLPWKVRLLTVLDVFEALTARDRPYKQPMPEDKAFSILELMVKDGQVDPDVLGEFRKSKAWE